MQDSTFFKLETKDAFQYIHKQPATTPRASLLLLHGILGGVDNWKDNIEFFVEQGYEVIVPVLPCYKLPLSETSVEGLATYVHQFISAIGIPQNMVVIGNSLGGQVAVFYAKEYLDTMVGMVLAGSSGIRELAMNAKFFRRKDLDFIRSRADMTFYDASKHVDDYFLKDVRNIVNDRGYALRLIKMARSSATDTVGDILPSISVPTLLVWGQNDQLTPPDVAHEFETALPDVELHFVNECGHAPMMEHPEVFNKLLLQFLQKNGW